MSKIPVIAEHIKITPDRDKPRIGGHQIRVQDI